MTNRTVNNLRIILSHIRANNYTNNLYQAKSWPLLFRLVSEALKNIISKS
jgi:hypothetical protein